MAAIRGIKILAFIRHFNIGIICFTVLLTSSCATTRTVDDVCLRGGDVAEMDKRRNYFPMKRLNKAPENADILKSAIIRKIDHPLNFQNQKVAWYESNDGPILFCNYEPASLGKAYEESFSWYLVTNEGSESEVLSQGANWVYLR